MTSGISRGSLGQRQRRVRAGASDALDGRRGVALEDGAVLDERQLLGRLLDRVPVRVLRAALDVVDLVARQVNGTRSRTRGLLSRRWATTPSVGACTSISRPVPTAAVTGPPGLADVDDPAPGDVALERPGRLQFDFGPGGFGDRCQFAVEVVHCGVPFRLPIESEPSGRSVRSGCVGPRCCKRRRQRRWIVEEVDGGGEEQSAGDGGGEVQDPVGVARRIAEEHVAQHLLGDRVACANSR